MENDAVQILLPIATQGNRTLSRAGVQGLSKLLQGELRKDAPTASRISQHACGAPGGGKPPSVGIAEQRRSDVRA